MRKWIEVTEDRYEQTDQVPPLTQTVKHHVPVDCIIGIAEVGEYEIYFHPNVKSMIKVWGGIDVYCNETAKEIKQLIERE